MIVCQRRGCTALEDWWGRRRAATAAAPPWRLLDVLGGGARIGCGLASCGSHMRAEVIGGMRSTAAMRVAPVDVSTALQDVHLQVCRHGVHRPRHGWSGTAGDTPITRCCALGTTLSASARCCGVVVCGGVATAVVVDQQLVVAEVGRLLRACGAVLCPAWRAHKSGFKGTWSVVSG